MSTVQKLKELTEELASVLEDLPIDELETVEEKLDDLHDKVDTIESTQDEHVNTLEEIDGRLDQVESDLGETVGREEYQRHANETEDGFSTRDATMEKMQQEIDELKSLVITLRDKLEEHINPKVEGAVV